MNNNLQSLQQEYEKLKAANLNLDLTRGKPSTEQLNLANEMDSMLNGDFKTKDGIDARNYGGLDGIPEAKGFGADLLNINANNVLVGGNSSLSLMHQAITHAHFFGVEGKGSAWINEQHSGPIKFLCPVPGYDRHFAICEEFNIEMINVSMTDNGPDMDQVESLIKNDPQIKGIWCVPQYSNPTGITYSDAVVERIARLGKIAGKHFRVMWDNAYTVHHLTDNPKPLANIMELSHQHGTEDNVLLFASTSKITFAGAGICFMGASDNNLKHFKQWLSKACIGPDKLNQLRHCRFLPDQTSIENHMSQHTRLLKPKFDAVIQRLEKDLGDSELGSWTKPEGGYFVSFDTMPGLAKEVVQLAADLGVKLTPAGATFPYRKDPDNKNIRLAPTFPTLEDVEQAMQVFTLCVRLATLRHEQTNGKTG